MLVEVSSRWGSKRVASATRRETASSRRRRARLVWSSMGRCCWLPLKLFWSLRIFSSWLDPFGVMFSVVGSSSKGLGGAMVALEPLPLYYAAATFYGVNFEITCKYKTLI